MGWSLVPLPPTSRMALEGMFEFYFLRPVFNVRAVNSLVYLLQQFVIKSYSYAFFHFIGQKISPLKAEFFAL